MNDKKITDLPTLTVADDTDLFAVVDVSGNVTKKVTRAGVVPDGYISTAKLADSSVTAPKLGLDGGLHVLVDRAYSSANVNTSGSGSYSTITGASVTFTAEAAQLYLITVTGGTVTNGTAGGTNVTLRLAEGTTALRDLSFSAPSGTKGVCPTIRHFTNSFSAGSVTLNVRGASSSATNVQWDGAGSTFCITVEKVLDA